MVYEVTGGYHVTYHPNEDNPSHEFNVDFTPPFRRVKYVYNIIIIISNHSPCAQTEFDMF